MINLPAAYVTALASDSFRPAYLVKLPALTLTTAPSDLVFNGDTYVSDGSLLSMDGIPQSTDITAATYTVTLDNADRTALSLYGSTNYVGAECVIYMALLNDDGTILGGNTTPFEIYKGQFEGWSVTESKTSSTIKVTIKSHWAAFNRKAGRFTNNASQQEVYPGDTIFQFAHMDGTEVRWGASNE